MTCSRKTGKRGMHHKKMLHPRRKSGATLKDRRDEAYYRVWRIHHKLRELEKMEDEAKAEFLKLDKALKARKGK